MNPHICTKCKHLNSQGTTGEHYPNGRFVVTYCEMKMAESHGGRVLLFTLLEHKNMPGANQGIRKVPYEFASEDIGKFNIGPDMQFHFERWNESFQTPKNCPYQLEHVISISDDYQI